MGEKLKPYLMTDAQVWQAVHSSEAGLNGKEAAHRLLRCGCNQLQTIGKSSLAVRLSRQLLDPMVLVLIAAALISAAINEWADSAIIGVVILLNACLGVYQEGKAERAVEALMALSAPTAVVRREGELLTIPAAQLVVGDMVLVEAGDAAPADIRLTSCYNLRADESALTGESQPVDKQNGVLEPLEGAVLAQRSNMLFMGCGVVYGRGEGCITATAMDTEMGKIAGMLADTQAQRTPLQKKLAELSRLLSLSISLICAFIFVFSLAKGGDFSGDALLSTFMLAISLAVAAIPEGLVVVVTLVLSLGTAVMSKQNAIIRRLPAVETLGAAAVICADKTGTLTRNRMTVSDYSGDPKRLAAVMAHCNDARPDGSGGFSGDPTEIALALFAREYVPPDQLWLRVGELPFDSSRKMMSTLHQQEQGQYIQYTKGAPEIIVGRCSHYLDQNGKRQPLSGEIRSQILREESAMAGRALRVLAGAERRWNGTGELIPQEQELTFMGLIGLIDPPRPEALAAVKAARRAGITTVMVSGDSAATARAIASALSILPEEGRVVTGSELEQLTEDQLQENIESYRVYARVKPEDKLRIVRAWQKLGRVTAMTGDGVNDAPALKAADIGCGMGISGSEVSKRVADLVLADDNFATIISAVREGRRIYENIRKAVQFLLSSNLAEVLAIFIATLLSVQLFLPIHLLWINLITDCFPAIALGLEKAEEDLMNKPPRRPEQGIFADGMGLEIVWQGLLVAVFTLV
ncbi:MAG: HAD-IC family P-type ATPase, partial [Clostridiales bacterium]